MCTCLCFSSSHEFIWLHCSCSSYCTDSSYRTQRHRCIKVLPTAQVHPLMAHKSNSQNKHSKILLNWNDLKWSGTLDQLFILTWVRKETWELVQQIHMCFVDWENAFNFGPLGNSLRVPPGVWDTKSASEGHSLPIQIEREFGPDCRQWVKFSPGGSWAAFYLQLLWTESLCIVRRSIRSN